MQILTVSEACKAATGLAQDLMPVTEVAGCRNSRAAFQLFLNDGRTNHFCLDQQFSLPDSLNIPIYRVALRSELSLEQYFVGYYLGNDGVAYGDKLLTSASCTYTGDRYAPIYVEIPIGEEVAAGQYPIEILLYRVGITGPEVLIDQKTVMLSVAEFTFPKEPAADFNLDIWQQPSNLARQFQVPLWSEAHFRLIREMADSLALLGQKAITVIAGEIPWKGWFNYLIKDHPANLYEYSMIPVVKDKSGRLQCDFSILRRYLQCFFDAGIDQEIEVFGLLGVWQPPFFPLIQKLDHPEKLVVRYWDTSSGCHAFIEAKADLLDYLQQVFTFFKEQGWWSKVRIAADEPKANEISRFKEAADILRSVARDLQLKVAFDKEPVLAALLPEVAYPVTSYYCTCNNYQQLSQSHTGKTQFYICNYPDKPNTFLHSPLLETRLLGTLAYYFKTDGLLRWAYNCWPEKAHSDIRYNTDNLPIGDLCLIYPGHAGQLLLSLRYKQLQRGIEDFYLLKAVAKKRPLSLQQLLTNFLQQPEPAEWMTDSHHSAPAMFQLTAADFEGFRSRLLELLADGLADG